MLFCNNCAHAGISFSCELFSVSKGFKMKFSKSRIVKILYYVYSSFVMLFSLFFALRNLRFLCDLKKINNMAISMFFRKNNDVGNNEKKYSKKSGKIQNVNGADLEKYEGFKDVSDNSTKNNDDFLKITENQFGKSGIKCENFYIKNVTGKDINFDSYMSQKPKIKIKNKNRPVVLIYHTHTTERYIDDDANINRSNYSSRSKDNSKNVVAVGDEIVNSLKKNGINSIHDCTVHDYPEYTGAYFRSAKTVRDIIKKNPEIQIEIDVHRDSINMDKRGKIKPTFKTKDGKKASQIMFISGCGMKKSLKFPNWEKNLILSMNLQKICEKNFPGFTRELFVKNVKYNQDINTGSLLVEVGSDVNTIEESKLAGRMLGESIAIFLKQYMK